MNPKEDNSRNLLEAEKVFSVGFCCESRSKKRSQEESTWKKFFGSENPRIFRQSKGITLRVEDFCATEEFSEDFVQKVKCSILEADIRKAQEKWIQKT